MTCHYPARKRPSRQALSGLGIIGDVKMTAKDASAVIAGGALKAQVLAWTADKATSARGLDKTANCRDPKTTMR
ncbi:MAG: hypothetical protein QOH06_2905 [Acidobacteriota bacterium]|jgi:hypothetical protein|nr:hypothetical protein [Acidobacteriota bacterium]